MFNIICLNVDNSRGGGGGHSLVSSVPMRDQRIVELLNIP